MYTTTTATREQALKATAAAERAMKRHACCKSQFKFKCFSCGEFINRGDKITRCNRATTGMKLRYRGADADHGLTMDETVFYQGTTGENMWVHIGCIPCYWDSLPEDSNEYSRPSLRPICTDWGVKVYGEWEEWANDDEPWSIIELGLPPPDVPYFCKIKGYPKEKFMRDRIIHNVTRFQALWRGYIYKQAYPTALAQYKTACRRQVLRYLFDNIIKLPSDCMFNWVHEMKVGDHGEILMDYKKKKEAIFSCEIIKKELNGGDNAYILVKYHHDGEVRRYYWRRYIDLIHECKDFKLEKEIEAKIIGKFPTGLLRYSKS